MTSVNASTIDSSWTDGPIDTPRPAAVLRGSARGLEIVVVGSAGTDAIISAVTHRLAEAPRFFRGSDARVRVDDGPLPDGCLARLEDVAIVFELRIVEVLDATAVPHKTLANGSVPWVGGWQNRDTVALAHIDFAFAEAEQQPSLPLGNPQPAPAAPSRPDPIPPPPPPVIEPTAEQLELALRSLEPDIEVIDEVIDEREPETRVVVGPVRSGIILEHRGHLVIFGDVNPGAEVRAEGNIVVLGRLRGTAHAGIGRDAAFILALRLQPQQLRISRTVARASEGDRPGADPEIAHVVGGTIIVERYVGRLPNGLAASI